MNKRLKWFAVPLIALILIGTFGLATASAAAEETSASSVTLNAVTLAEHSSYASSAYFGVINLAVADANVAAATTDSQGRVVITAIGSGSTRVLYWFRNDASGGWTRAVLPVTVSGTAAATAADAASDTGLVFPQSSVSLSVGTDYTVTGITRNGSPVEASGLLWVSSSSAVATAETNTGKITAVGPGTAVVYALDPSTGNVASINLSVN